MSTLSTHHMARDYSKIAMLGSLNLTSHDKPKIYLSEVILITWQSLKARLTSQLH